MSKRKTPQEFLHEIKHRTFVSLDPYRTAAIKMKFRCTIDGHTWKATANNVIRGSGCPMCKRINISIRNRGHNRIISKSDSVIVLDVSRTKFPCATMTISTSDYHKFANLGRAWIQNNGYCCISVSGRFVGVHRFLMGITDASIDTDHINHDKTDNRRENLREVTRSQNCMNSKLSKRNSSGKTGVSFIHARGKWNAELSKNRMRVHRSSHDTFAQAVAARELAEKEHHSEFAYSHNNTERG